MWSFSLMRKRGLPRAVKSVKFCSCPDIAAANIRPSPCSVFRNVREKTYERIRNRGSFSMHSRALRSSWILRIIDRSQLKEETRTNEQNIESEFRAQARNHNAGSRGVRRQRACK